MIALLLSVLLAPQAATPQPSPLVVHCYDPSRDIVQERLAETCEGRVVDAAEAAAIRARLARERARKVVPPDGAAPADAPTGRRIPEFGTAFAIDAEGHYLTAAHVVDVCPLLFLRSADGADAPGRVVASDRERDIALLASTLTMLPLPLAAGDIDLETPVRIIGYPFEGLPRLKPRITEGTLTAAATLPGRGPYLALRLFVRAGTSGGPVLDEANGVIGMLVAKINTPAIFALSGESVRDLSYAVAGESLADFLAANGVATESGAPSQDPAASVVRVECRDKTTPQESRPHPAGEGDRPESFDPAEGRRESS